MYAQTADEVPDYYLGCLLWYDELGDDNCRWVVYDGTNRVRCPSRTDAIDYIAARAHGRSEEVSRRLVSARLHINHAFDDLQAACRAADPADAVVFERISARLRPFLVELDNKILT